MRISRATCALLILSLLLPALGATAASSTTCISVGALVCAGEATQPCGGPAPYGDGWTGFTGVWGEAAGVEYGAGGWDRCHPAYWSAGAFVNMDDFPLGGYETVQARFDRSPESSRPCSFSAGAYGHVSRYQHVACPDEDLLPLPVPDPGWGAVLP